MQRDNFTCRNCGDSARSLNVHHRYYEKGMDPWEYPEIALICLCEECHVLVHEGTVLLNKALCRLSPTSAHGLVRALQSLKEQDVDLTSWIECAKHSDLLREAWERLFAVTKEESGG